MAKTYDFHEVANIFPLIEGKEFSDFVEDIKKNGLREEIWLYQNKIIDGRNRYRACLQAGIEPRFQQFDGKLGLVDFVVSLNLKRRHLDAGQRAIVALNVMDYLKVEAKGRQATSTGGKNPQLTQKIEEAERGESADKAAKLVNTNRQYIYEAQKMRENKPEMVAKIMKNETTFAKVVKETKMEDRKVKIAAQKEEIKKLVVPNQKYNVVVIDPPWPMEDTDNYDPENRRAVPPYPTMTLEQIQKLKLPLEDDCIVWVWGIEKFLKPTLEIIEKWGLEKKNTLIWDKVTFGMAGKFMRPQHEYCFLCIKGNPKIYGEGTGTILRIQKKAHSEKPDEFYQLVEKICPYPKKLDYFARKKRQGWDVYGDEL